MFESERFSNDEQWPDTRTSISVRTSYLRQILTFAKDFHFVQWVETGRAAGAFFHSGSNKKARLALVVATRQAWLGLWHKQMSAENKNELVTHKSEALRLRVNLNIKRKVESQSKHNFKLGKAPFPVHMSNLLISPN